MKKIIVFLAIMSMAGVSMAQRGYRDFRSKARLGFTVSPMISVLKPQEAGVNRNSAKPGLDFGLMADFNLNEKGTYAFASGFQVLLAGSKLKYDAGKGLNDYRANPAEYNMKLTYIEIPLSLKLRTSQEYSDISWWGQFGSYLDFPVSGRANIVSMDQTYEKEGILPQMNRINIGMLLGAGVEYPLGPELTGTAGIIYQNGFVDVTRNGKWDDGRINMNSFALRLGIYF